jgi:hypothetical protein
VRGGRNNPHLIGETAGLLTQHHRQGPILGALKALSAMHSLGKRTSSVQLRVRAPSFSEVPTAAARGCRRLCAGSRARAPAVEPALRQVSYARRAQGSTGDCDHSWPASIEVMQRTFNPWNRERYPGGPPSFALSQP